LWKFVPPKFRSSRVNSFSCATIVRANSVSIRVVLILVIVIESVTFLSKVALVGTTVASWLA